MSATDDARSPSTRPAIREPGARVPAAFALAGILPGALLGAALFAMPGVLPAWPRYATTLPWDGAAPHTRATSPWADAVRLPGAVPRLEVRAPSRAAAEALAERFEVERAGDGAPERDRRARLRAELAPRAPDPLPALAPATECATLLAARARIGRTLAGEGPVLAADDASSLPPALRDADQAVEAAALAFDPAALRPALAEADRLERAWLERLAAEDATRAFEAWRARERSRAAEFEDAAAVLAADVTPFQHTLSAWWLPIFALDLEPGVPDASRAVSATRAAHPAPARPWWPAWVVAALAGALAGGAGSWLAARARPLPRPRRPLEIAERHVLPATSQAALHVLSGVEPRRVALAALDVAAHFVARGERVLVIDGARHLRMHEQLGLEGGAGTLDCLAGRATLGTCAREVWGEGLYLLPVGLSGAGERWPELGRLMDEARSRFDRVVLVLDAAAPHAVGEALAGRLVEGWWAGAARPLPRVALALQERIEISMTGLGLSASPETLLEAFPERLSALRPDISRLAPAAPAVAADDAALPRMPVVVGPAILDCDLHVRQRLRFLIWMRRLQAESQREPMVATPRA